MLQQCRQTLILLLNLQPYARTTINNKPFAANAPNVQPAIVYFLYKGMFFNNIVTKNALFFNVNSCLNVCSKIIAFDK